MLICDFVAGNNDRRTLKRCVLVCSQLASYCNTYLFARVKLSITQHRDAGFQRSFLKFARIIEKNRSIASCIKTLTLNFSSHYHQTSLPPFFAGSTNVTELHLWVSKGLVDERPTLLPDTTDAIFDSILSSGKLKKLYIGEFLMPSPAFFTRCSPSLTHLELCRMDEHDGTELLPSERGRPGPPIQLRHIDAHPTTLARFAGAEREDGQPVFDFSRLRSVVTSFKGYEDSAWHLNALLRHEVPLETLDVSLRCKFASFLS